MRNAKIEAIKENAEIVRIINEILPLKKQGQQYIALCPFHDEKNPSFKVSPRKQFFYCFGCGESGDVFDFVMKTNGVGFRRAVWMVDVYMRGY